MYSYSYIGKKMRDYSPDGIRPSKELMKKAEQNFKRKDIKLPKLSIKSPSPNELPIPKKLTRKKSESKPEIIIKGKKRDFIVRSKGKKKSKKK